MSIACSHILVKHEGSRNPTSWRDPQGLRIKKTTLEQAITQMEAIRERIATDGESFYELAAQISDCGSAQHQGKLGEFTRGQMQAQFEDAAFALKVGQISPVIVSDSGVHIILRYL